MSKSNSISIIRPLAGFVFTAIAAVALQVQAAPDRAVAAPTVAAPTTELAANGMTKSGSMKISAADRKFVIHAANAGHAEVEAAQVALDRSTDPSVKDFAKRMFNDHGKANTELLTIGNGLNVKVPTGPDAKQNLALKKIKEVKPADFDKLYMKDFGAAPHRKVIAMFEKEVKSGTNPELKEFAQKTLPTLKEHLSMAEGVKVGAAESDGSGKTQTAAR